MHLCISKKKDQATDEQMANSSAPLLGAKAIPDAHVVLGEFNAKFTNFNPDEEATIINSLTFLRFQPLMYYLVAPLLMLCTVFIFGLFLFWFPNLRSWMFYKKVKTIEEATHVLIDGKMTETPEVEPLFAGDLDGVAKETFIFRFINFQFDQDSQCFNPVQFNTQMTYSQILDQYRHGISVAEVEQMRYKYGICQLLVPIKSIPRLLVDEILNPFYIFQVFSMILWFNDGYQKYAFCIFAVSFFGVLESLIETVSNYRSIQKMARYECQVQVKRWEQQPNDNESLLTVCSEDLVPGDVIVVPNNCTMPCDAVLLSGSCIVNESMLTGESVPMRKLAIEQDNKVYDAFDFDSCKKITLFSGTQVIQTRLNKGDEHTFALVTRTGFITTKGSLVRDILYPRATKFKFYQDSLIFVGAMALISIIGFFCLLPRLIAIKTEPAVLVDKALDLITICVPPALPATMSAGVAFAVQRLKKKKIYCISPPRVNISGRIQIMVFDKTGTLTEDGLQIIGIRGTEAQKLKGAIQSIKTSSAHHFDTGICFTQFVPSILNIIKLDSNNVILNESMASCHSITQVDEELVGDPLEIKMFQLTGWQLDEGEEQNFSPDVLAQIRPKIDGSSTSGAVSILRRFDFESKLQRMSVIVQNHEDSSVRVHLKGSPEKVQELCLPHTLPNDFQETLDLYTAKGYRVIALASKFISADSKMQDLKTWPRESFENELTFLGIIVMENKLKEATQPTITTLNECNIRTIMATGDNTLTAISVGSSCNILKDDQTVYFGDLGENNQIIWKNSKLLVQQNQETSAVESDSNKDYSENEKEMVLTVNNAYTDVPWDQALSNNFGVALNGKLLNFLSTNRDQYSVSLNKILSKAQVYARMSPEDKADLVNLLQQTMKVQVGMCGDGANDCSALKQADAGISLSEAEASIAAPFTSKVQDISCVITLLREGRAALTTTFQAFKFIELYSIIQFISVSLLYLSKSNLSDNQFLYIDIGVLVPLCIFQSWTGAHHQLTKHLPQESLFSAPVLVSVIGSSAIQLFFQVFAYFQTSNLLVGDEYVECIQAATVIDDDPPCSQNTSLFLISCQQYVICCLTFSIAKPFRKPIWQNPLFFISVLIMLSYQSYLFFNIDDWSQGVFDLIVMPSHFKYYLLTLFLINSFLTYFYEKLFIGWFSRRYNERMTRLRKMEFERLLVDGTAAMQNKEFSKTANENQGEYHQFEGGNVEGGAQKLFSTSNIDHPLYLESEIAGNECDDDLGDTENDGWKNIMDRYEENTIK